MKQKFYILLIFLFCKCLVQAQVFWTEAFGSGSKNTSADALDTGNGPWTETAIGTQGTKANSWFASKEECGNAAGVCGSVCPSDASLHVGSTSAGFCSGGDCGAAYLAASTSKTEKEAISPDISTVGYAGIALAFNYIGYGEGTQDIASWSYSCDGGTSWTFVTNLTTNCCNSSGSAVSCTAGICGLLGCQGRWTAYSYTLPSCADDISNFKIKFNWKNDNDNNGNDPSFAVDDITLAYSILPVELISFSAETAAAGVVINWSTLTEINTDHFEMERSFDSEQFITIGNVTAAGNSTQQVFYEFTDEYYSGSTRYYRLKLVDVEGSFQYSKTISVTNTNQQSNYFAQQTSDELILSSVQFRNSDLYFEVFDVAGKIVVNYTADENATSLSINLHDFLPGFYILCARTKTGENLFTYKFSKI